MMWAGHGDDATPPQPLQQQGEEPEVAEAVPTDHVIVNDLPGTITEEQLKEIFGVHGTIKWNSLRRDWDANTASAIIELESVEEATYMVVNLNGNIPAGLSGPVR